ncbi:MAG: type II toxin-antitoxin system RelE/ParE family toxin [Planctomycetota bacterium]
MVKTRLLRWTDRAQTDLLAIGRFIARDKPDAARNWVEALRIRAQKVIEQPFSGRQVPEIGREDIREVLHDNYRIVYIVLEKTIDVLVVFEGHKLLPKQQIEARSKRPS